MFTPATVERLKGREAGARIWAKRWGSFKWGGSCGDENGQFLYRFLK